MEIKISRKEAAELFTLTGKLKYRILSEMVGGTLDDAIDELAEFLISRESDIALDIENFALLRGIFIVKLGREPSK